MSTLYANFVAGILDAPLAIDGVTMSSPSLAAAPVVTGGNIFRITLEPNSGKVEIVHVIEHGDGATTATIIREQEGTTAVAHAINKPWVHSFTAADMVAFVAPPPAGLVVTFNRTSATIYPSATMNVDGAPVVMTPTPPATSYVGVISGNFNVTGINADAGELITVSIKTTNSDASTIDNPSVGETTVDGACGSIPYYNMDGMSMVSFAGRCQSTLDNSAVSCVLILTGLQQ